MRRIFLALSFLAFLLSCKNENKKGFEVSGTIRNGSGKMLYLEETPIATGQRIVADSFVISKDGSYHVKAKRSEESLFQLVLDSDNYPLAVIINDASNIKLNADLNQRNDYDVQGSPASR